MSRAWMPLYVADYLADTGHLTTAEHGAYMLLIMHYWSNGGLPDDERKLARITRMSPDEWAEARDTIHEFFDAGWRHKRIDAEFARAAEKSDKAAASANKRWMRTHSEGICERNANAMLPQSQSQSHISSNEDITREATPLAILSECLTEQTAKDLITHRQAKRTKLTPRAARELVKAFRDYGDPEAAAAEMMLRGWTGFKSDWMQSKARAGPSQSKKGWGALWVELNGYGDGREAKRADENVSVLPRSAVDGNRNGDGDAGGVSGNLIELFAGDGR